MSESITSELCRRALAISLDSLQEEVIEISRQCFLDWLGVTLIGAAEGLTESLARVLTAQDGPGRTGSIIGRSEKLGSVHAALLNETASHAIDYDDVNFSIPGHGSAPVIAAALAVGEEIGATGRQILEAFIAGYETSCRIGALLAPDHYAMGFHSTATAGTFGATAACQAAGTRQRAINSRTRHRGHARCWPQGLLRHIMQASAVRQRGIGRRARRPARARRIRRAR